MQRENSRKKIMQENNARALQVRKERAKVIRENLGIDSAQNSPLA